MMYVLSLMLRLALTKHTFHGLDLLCFRIIYVDAIEAILICFVILQVFKNNRIHLTFSKEHLLIL